MNSPNKQTFSVYSRLSTRGAIVIQKAIINDCLHGRLLGSVGPRTCPILGEYTGYCSHWLVFASVEIMVSNLKSKGRIIPKCFDSPASFQPITLHMDFQDKPSVQVVIDSVGEGALNVGSINMLLECSGTRGESSLQRLWASQRVCKRYLGWQWQGWRWLKYAFLFYFGVNTLRGKQRTLQENSYL